jgi:protoheme IX farnesyltransferase
MDQKINKYLELTKPKVTLLNLFVGVTCFILASYPVVEWTKLAAFSIVGYLAAGGCGVLNSAYDKDIDRLMGRTSRRAIPSGHIASNKAIVFGILMTCSGLFLSILFFNLLTALMIGLGAVFYLIVYTVWLKRVSPWNVVIGGFAGCFAALSGWTAVANSVGFVPLLISAVDFLWTPGHLWGLAIRKMKEYKSAGIPMLPVKVGLSKAGKVVFLSNAVTVAFSFLFPLLGLTGSIYLGFAVLGGCIFLAQNRGLLFSASEAYGFKAFVASMPYLACLMSGLILDKIFLI